MISRNPLPRAGTTSTGSSVRNTLRAFAHHKRKMLLVFVATLTIAVAGILAIPRSYVSESQLFLRLGR